MSATLLIRLFGVIAGCLQIEQLDYIKDRL